MSLCSVLAQSSQPSTATGAAPLPYTSGMTPSYVCAHDLTLALRAASPELALRTAEVARREGELRLAELGLATAVTVSTGVELGANLAREQEPSWSPALQMDADLHYRYDEVAIARARAALATAVRREAAQQRADVLSALVSLSRLRAAQRLAAQTDLTAAEAESLAASVRQSAASAYPAPAGADPGTEPGTTPPDLALNIRELDLAAARARATAAGRAADTAEALAELQRLGVTASNLFEAGGAQQTQGPADCLTLPDAPLGRALGPELPQPDSRRAAERHSLLLAVDLTAAQHSRAALGPLRDLSLSAHYQEGGARILAELELDGGRPAAGLNVRWRQSTAHNWGVGVAASIRLDDAMGAALETARQQMEAAQAAVRQFDEQFPARVAAQVGAAEAAWLQLLFALEAVSIARERLALATDEREVARTQQVLGRSLDALEREYQAYLRALGRYLNEFELPWRQLAAPN